MLALELERQIHRAFTIINSAVENPCTGRKLNAITKKKLFLFFYWLTELQAKEHSSYHSEKYSQIIRVQKGDIRKSWDQIAEYMSANFQKEICRKTATRLADILSEMGLLTVVHESLSSIGWSLEKIKSRGKSRSLKVIRLKTFSDFEEWEAEIAVEKLIQDVNVIVLSHTDPEGYKEYCEVVESFENSSEMAISESVQNSVHQEKSFCPTDITPNTLDIYNTHASVGQKLIAPAESENWYVEIADGGVVRDRQVIPRDELPEEPDREFYFTWIGEKSGQFWTPWVIWDIDVDETEPVQIALDRTRDFVADLQKAGVPEEALRIVFSTRRGFHVYLDSRTIALKPSEKLHRQLWAFAKRLLPECDESLYSLRHLIGIPNSLHRKTGLYYSVLSIEELNSFPIEQMFAHARHPHEFDPRPEHVSPVSKLCELFAEATHTEPRKFFPSLAEIKKKVRTPPTSWYGVSRGQRDRAMFDLAVRYFRIGLTNEEAMVLVLSANARNNPPLPEADIFKKVNSAYSKEGAQIL